MIRLFVSVLALVSLRAGAATMDIAAAYDKTEVGIAMRDGVSLHTVIYSPKDHSKRYPLLLQRTPYSAGPYGPAAFRRPEDMAPSPAFVREGYIFVFQDVRGAYQSDGEWVNLRPLRTGSDQVDENTDTWDTIDWLVKRVPNNNGRVGQWGISHPGWYTVMGMVDAHPALRAASPQGTTFDAFIGDDDHHNGAFVLPGVEWWYRIGIRTGPERRTIGHGMPANIDFGQPWDYEFFLRAGATNQLNERYFGGRMARDWRNVLEHPDYDAFWTSRNVRNALKKIRVPVLNVTGWFDSTDPYGTIATYHAIDQLNPHARNTLVVGPWAHGGWQETDGSHVGPVQFESPTAAHFQDAIELPFFEHYLKDKGDAPAAKVFAFQTGANRWRQLGQWPPTGVTAQPLYFSDAGRLSFTAPVAASASDSYLSDPAHPVPYTAKILRESDDVYLLGDQRFAFSRPDVVTYQTEALTQDLTIAGPIPVDLFVSSTGTDGDWLVKLIDVYPGNAVAAQPNPEGVPLGGYQALLGVEVMRAKYRAGFEKPLPLIPGELTHLHFEIRDQFHTFKTGHRLMVQVQSSFFPVFDRNPQVFTNIYRAEPAAYQKATQTLHRTASAASRLLLPVVTDSGTSTAETYDVVIRGGSITDGTGAAGFVGDVGIRGDRIVYVGKKAPAKGRREIDARGKVVAPGFINQMSYANESLVADGRGLSDLYQGVTLEVVDEGASPGPLPTPDSQVNPFGVTLASFFEGLERQGIAQNVAAHVGATTVRRFVLGEDNVAPTAAQLAQMQGLVREAMEQGAVGISSALIYTPATFSTTDELAALATEAGKCGGFYISHLRSEGARFLEALDELIEIARRSGAPAEVFHIKAGGVRNWPKLSQALAKIRAARASGLKIRANMYAYPASGTGLDASMPPWVREGGLDAWIARMKDPQTRARLLADMRDPNPSWENVLQMSGSPDRALVAGVRTPALKPLIGKSLAEIARQRGVTPEEAAIDLVIEDHSRIGIIYFTVDEKNLLQQIREPYMSFVSDAPSISTEAVPEVAHPRAFGSFARVYAEYVRKDPVLSVAEAVHRMTGLPAAKLSLTDRGLLRNGYVADVVVFDPKTLQDRGTYVKPNQYATGVDTVLVNGELALADGKPTGSTSGRFVRGRAWKNGGSGGCRASAGDWTWTD